VWETPIKNLPSLYKGRTNLADDFYEWDREGTDSPERNLRHSYELRGRRIAQCWWCFSLCIACVRYYNQAEDDGVSVGCTRCGEAWRGTRERAHEREREVVKRWEGVLGGRRGEKMSRENEKADRRGWEQQGGNGAHGTEQPPLPRQWFSQRLAPASLCFAPRSGSLSDTSSCTSSRAPQFVSGDQWARDTSVATSGFRSSKSRP